MDNNNLQTTSVSQAPIPPAPTQPVVPQNVVPSPSGGSNKMILLLVLGLIVVIALVGGIYMFLSNQGTASIQQPATSNLTQAPAKAPEESLESEINSIDVDNGAESDFTSVDSDLQKL